jgi:hypothetical protein
VGGGNEDAARGDAFHSLANWLPESEARNARRFEVNDEAARLALKKVLSIAN